MTFAHYDFKCGSSIREGDLLHRGDERPHRPPELQRFVANRMGAKTYEVSSSQVPMLSNPSLVIDVIRTAANAVQEATAAA